MMIPTSMPRRQLGRKAAAAALFLLAAVLAHAATQTDIAGPAGSNDFGGSVTALPNGNIVVVDAFHEAPGGVSYAGAVHLYNGATGALISTMSGTTAYDYVGGGGVSVLANGDYVVLSLNWDRDGVADVGAATLCSGTSGCPASVSADNSIVGSTAGDNVGSNGIVLLANGNYLVQSPSWDNGTLNAAGAVTFCSGTAGCTGPVTSANSLVGTSAADNVGTDIVELRNGNYVVRTPLWNNGAIADAGAVTWCDGATGCTGAVTAENSLVGTTAADNVGGRVAPLTNGNYAVQSQLWDNAGIQNAGAVTFCSGTAGCTAAVSAANSLVGSTANDNVGLGVASSTFPHGNYVVRSPNWDSDGVANVGAATFCNGTTGCTGAITAENSLVGSTAGDAVGTGVGILSDGSYVVRNPSWDNGSTANVGAVTQCEGDTGCSGAVSPTNSLIGSTAGDQVGGAAVLALRDGHYAVASPGWDNGGACDVGAVTWCSGAAPCTGAVAVTNSLVGSSGGDGVGYGIAEVGDGNYVVLSAYWDNGAINAAGAATFCNGASGCVGEVTASNSLVGSQSFDNVGLAIETLTNGNYVVRSPQWDNGATANVGAATWCSGAAGCTGAVSAANSLVGSAAGDTVSSNSVTALSNGAYVVWSSKWNNGAIVDAGAITYGDGNGGTVGEITAENSVGGTSGYSGRTLRFEFDPANNQLVVGRPADNLVTLLRFETASVRITSITKSGSSVLLRGVGVPNAEHNVEATPSLAQPFDPNPLGTVIADSNGNFEFTDNTALPQRFYRVVYP